MHRRQLALGLAAAIWLALAGPAWAQATASDQPSPSGPTGSTVAAAADEALAIAAQVSAGPANVAPGTLAERGQSLLGLVVLIAATWALGRAVRGRYAPQTGGTTPAFPWRLVGWGVALQFVFAGVVLFDDSVLAGINNGIQALLNFTRAGASVVFGDLALPTGIAVFAPDGSLVGSGRNVGYFAFFVLPTIIFFSALTAVLYHLGIMQWIVHALAWVMSRTMKTSGAETLSTAANIFVGQTEAPLMVKPFLAGATRSEVMCIMVGGFANIATGVLGIYTEWLSPHVANAGGHLAAACLISAPATLVVAKLLVPETQQPQTVGGVPFRVEKIDTNTVDAAARGTAEGLHLALNVAAMLIAFTALVALLNAVIGWSSVKVGLATPESPLTMQALFGILFRPLAWLTGVPWAQADEAGTLLGIKTVLNELLAYDAMRAGMASAQAAGGEYLSPRSALITAYALCGFANFASVGIQVGGISALAPGQRHNLSKLGLLAMLGGAVCSLMTACVIGVIV